jgi:biotin operon repressor
MSTIEKILNYSKNKEFFTGRDLSESLGISRQAVNKHLKKLIQDGEIVKQGTTRGTVYQFAATASKLPLLRRVKKVFLLSGLEEDKVFRELAQLLNLKRELNKNSFDIVYYAFTEMLNNSIDHSKSKRCDIGISLDQYTCNFIIRDSGIGIFYSIFSKLQLSDENAAIGELIKGKTTTMKERHTGEGIFFTSKAADSISFRSHKINLIFDNREKDVYVEEKKFIKGTEVSFSVSRRTKSVLSKIFSQYAPEEFDYKFERTRALVKLFHKNYVSRSEAKRLLHGLDKFKEILLDFKGVTSIGQGFADEIFRIFVNEHPTIKILPVNLRSTLQPVINHVIDKNN